MLTRKPVHLTQAGLVAAVELERTEVYVDTFHDEVSSLVSASQSRLVSGKHGEELMTYAYAFRLGCLLL